jgi:hypothetical protein
MTRWPLSFTAVRCYTKSGDTTYAGRIDVSNVKVLSIQGTADAVTLDMSEHERTANMNAGRVVDYSESDIINHMTLVRVNGSWVVSSMDWRFAPGSEP